MPFDLFTPSLANTANISATTSSARVAIPAGGQSVRVHNAASVAVFIQFGDSSVTATTSHMPIPAGGVETFNEGGATHVAAITASGSGTIYFTSGSGA